MAYEVLEHTADLRVRVTAKELDDLFQAAGLALFDLIVEGRTTANAGVIDVKATGADPPDLLVNFLRELLFLWSGHEKVIDGIHVKQVSCTAVSARITVVPYSTRHHRMRYEVKAVTYHQIEVSRTPTGWQAVVVLDI